MSEEGWHFGYTAISFVREQLQAPSEMRTYSAPGETWAYTLSMGRIRDFWYRSPRFTAHCRMDLIQGDAVFLGTCTDISESGLRGTFSEQIALGTHGLLTLYHEQQTCQMQATVDSVHEDEVRIQFNFATDKERLAVSALIKSLAAQSGG